MTTVPAQDFDVICDLLCGMFSEKARPQVIDHCRQRDARGADLLERIFNGERSAELFPQGRVRAAAGMSDAMGGLFASTDDLGEHPEDSGESYNGNGNGNGNGKVPTPDPFAGEAILVRNAFGLNNSGVIREVGQELVDECRFLAVENPDRTIRVIKMLDEPGGRNMACAPRSFIPKDATVIDLKT